VQQHYGQALTHSSTCKWCTIC